MKIAFLITYFYPQTGGAENNCYFLARELAKRNKVHVFCSGRKDSKEKIAGMNIHRSKEIFRIKYYLALYPSIVRKMIKEKFDIIHIHGLGFIQHDYALKKIKEKYPETKIVCTAHGPFMALKKYNFILGLLRRIYTPFLKKSLRKYSNFVKVNPFQERWMKEEYEIPKDKIKFLPNGIPKDTFKKLEKGYIQKIKKKYDLEGKFVISYLGRIQEYKGLDQIIRVLQDITKTNDKIIFLGIGKDAGDRERLENLAKELGVENNIVFTGEVSEKDKLALLDISEIFIFPSEWEAFGISMLEAMARKNAVISTKTEGGLYLIQDGKNGFLYNYKNIKELKKKLEKLVKNKKLREKMKNGNKKKAKEFLWENITKDLERLYKSLLAS